MASCSCSASARGWACCRPIPGSLSARSLLALALVTLGLLSSTLHLGHPERAWRAISQWRSSWLSREGALALLTYLPALILGLGWLVSEPDAGWFVVPGLLAALGAAATVWCTGMIYASLQPIRQWHQPLTAPVYLAFALMSGALLLHLVLALFGLPRLAVGSLALVATILAFGLKAFYWRAIARAPPLSTPESATGLGAFGLVRMVEPPHTQTNYLLSEMGFVVARRHARKLRRLAYALGLGGGLGPDAAGAAGIRHPRRRAGAARSARGARGHRARALAVLRRGDPHGDAVLRSPAGRAGGRRLAEARRLECERARLGGCQGRGLGRLAAAIERVQGLEQGTDLGARDAYSRWSAPRGGC